MAPNPSPSALLGSPAEAGLKGCAAVALLSPKLDTKFDESAAEKVGRVVELTEQILQHLPFVDLLSAKLICKQWRDIIKASLPVQQQLFVVPFTYPPTLKLPGYLLPKSGNYGSGDHQKDALYIVEPIGGQQWHPMLQELFQTRDWQQDDDPAASFRPFSFHLDAYNEWVPEWKNGEVSFPRYPELVRLVKKIATAADGEWQLALCSQPPTALLECTRLGATRYRGSRQLEVLFKMAAEEGSDGVSMGQIQACFRDLVVEVDVVAAQAGKFERSVARFKRTIEKEGYKPSHFSNGSSSTEAPSYIRYPLDNLRPARREIRLPPKRLLDAKARLKRKQDDLVTALNPVEYKLKWCRHLFGGENVSWDRDWDDRPLILLDGRESLIDAA
ncbi:hypothetical protein BU16DRAFT_540108 [Lophium mytilinum]|uniref:F-box domain-containing protein n=1 Tax=Lophium mytilinum TaxID=390894 RepID=A0A6A6QQU8_9PEZI|nr:hypothetical protein BU16DRAFT_540108 [Lophium mytilinum]